MLGDYLKKPNVSEMKNRDSIRKKLITKNKKIISVRSKSGISPLNFFEKHKKTLKMTGLDKKNLIINKTDTLKSILKALEESKCKVLFCVDKDNSLFGSITDGDIRRALLKYDIAVLTAEKNMQSKPLYSNSDNIDEVLIKAKKKQIKAFPILKDRRVSRIFVVDYRPSKKMLPVVIMAGGLGKRLGSMTKDKPKPLVEISENLTIIDVIISNLISQGFSEMHFMLNYKASQIENHLKEKFSDKLSLNFVTEKNKMGTAGSLYYLKDKLKKNFILMNADIITNLDFSSLINFHKKNRNLISVVANKTSYQLSKGIIEYSGNRIKAIKEKPSFDYTYNAGIYIINSKCLKDIQEEYLDMPDLINSLIETKKVRVFPLMEYWKDLGILEDLEAAKGFNEWALINMRY